jgi:hypothetical protein
MNRRGFLKAMVAPAIILTPGLLMPVRAFGSALSFVQSGTGATLSYAAILHGDGIRDDTAALQAFLNGEPVMYQGQLVQDRLGVGTFLISRQIDIIKPVRREMRDCTIIGRLPANDAMLCYHNSYLEGQGVPGFPLRNVIVSRTEP